MAEPQERQPEQLTPEEAESLINAIADVEREEAETKPAGETKGD